MTIPVSPSDCPPCEEVLYYSEKPTNSAKLYCHIYCPEGSEPIDPDVPYTTLSAKRFQLTLDITVEWQRRILTQRYKTDYVGRRQAISSQLKPPIESRKCDSPE